MTTCRSCGQENPDGFAFCGACGTPLAGAEPPREVRKTVSVLFCDMVGSTAMGDHTDPERVRELMASYHDMARRVLERHGATIEKFIGDAVMAVFGVPSVHEDDALRAVRAATELRDELAAAGIPVRIGINTGEVVAGRGEALVTGDAVNVAARLEQAAGQGEVLIGDTTHRLTRDAVNAERVEALEVKGKPEPLVAYRLLSVNPVAQAIPRRADSSLVGRARELNMLSEAFARAETEERCHLFTVMGAPGVGKSRLVAELAGGRAASANILVGQCLPYGEGITFWPVAEMLRTAAGIGERDDRATARAALERLVADDEDGMLVADRIANAIGMGGSPAPAEEVFWALRRAFELIARTNATVLVFEDVHWAEPTLLDLIEHIADWARGGAILIVCTARPDLLDIRPSWAGGTTNATTILLEPLDESDCAALLEELLGTTSLTDDQRLRIVGAAEGNPLFVEQMLAMLGDDDQLAEVPLTIQALLAARLDRLDGEERRVVESASVEGRVFHQSALAALAPDAAGPALAAHLQRLMRRELIDPDRSLFEGDSAYRFQHVLIRDAAYSSLPKRARAELHERFAEWLAGRVAHRIDEYREILAFHVEQAYLLLADVAPDDPSLGALAERAATFLTEAAQQADRRGDLVTAHALLGRAAAVPQPNPAAQLDLLITQGRLGTHAADAADQIALLERGEQLARELGDEVRLLHMRVVTLDARLMSDTSFSTADARAIAEEAAKLFDQVGALDRLYDALYAISNTYHHEGRWSLMDVHLARAEEIARQLGDVERERDAATYRVSCAFWGDGPASSGLAACERLLARWPDSPVVRSRSLAWQARFLGILGRFDEAWAVADVWLEEVEGMGDRLAIGSKAFMTGMLAEMDGNLERAVDETAESIAMLDAAGHRGLVSTLEGFNAVNLAVLGRWDEAENAVARSRETSHPDDLDSESFWRLGEARLLDHDGRHQEAIAAAREAIEIIDRSDEILFQGNARMLLGELLARQGDTDGARGAFEEALALYRRKECVPAMGRAEAQLAALSVRPIRSSHGQPQSGEHPRS